MELCESNLIIYSFKILMLYSILLDAKIHCDTNQKHSKHQKPTENDKH